MNDNHQSKPPTVISPLTEKQQPKHARPDSSAPTSTPFASAPLPASSSSKTTEDAPVAKAKSRSGILSFLIYVVIIFAVFFFVRTFVFIPYDIPSGSMEDTIMPGDMVFSEKISYYVRKPAQGDIVTFADPLVAGRTLIKRVIATEGQTIDFLDGKVVIDGVVQDEAYTLGKATLPFDQTAPNVQISYPYTVPAGHIWVMGDNRPFSQDSRYFGAIETDTVTGRAAMIYWPFSDFRIF